MTAIPLHIKRRFEQRWASRFNPPAASSLPQISEPKLPPSSTVRYGKTPRKIGLGVDGPEQF
jgi:hypothetical protein